jgi:hypothetical protein
MHNRIRGGIESGRMAELYKYFSNPALATLLDPFLL